MVDVSFLLHSLSDLHFFGGSSVTGRDRAESTERTASPAVRYLHIGSLRGSQSVVHSVPSQDLLCRPSCRLRSAYFRQGILGKQPFNAQESQCTGALRRWKKLRNLGRRTSVKEESCLSWSAQALRDHSVRRCDVYQDVSYTAEQAAAVQGRRSRPVEAVAGHYSETLLWRGS